MNTDEVMESLKSKFTSGNSVAVSQSTITREEYKAILAYQQATKESEARIETLKKDADAISMIHLYFLTIECRGTWYYVWQGEFKNNILATNLSVTDAIHSAVDALKEADR